MHACGVMCNFAISGSFAALVSCRALWAVRHIWLLSPLTLPVVTLQDARVEVEKIIGRGSGFVAVEIPFTPRAKRVLELSLEEARQLGICAR